MISRTLVAAICILAATPALSELQLYDVEAEYRQEVFEVLRGILRGNISPSAPAYGRVEMLPTGQILIDAAAEKQAEIAALLDSIASRSVAETPTITLRYWVLFGVVGAEQQTAVPPMLDGVVREWESAHGKLGVTVLDVARLVGRSGHPTALQSQRMEIYQKAYASQNRINAEIVIQHQYQELEVEVSLKHGDFLVLGETTVENEKGVKGTIVFVVHWPEED